jgi:hypothetical protein
LTKTGLNLPSNSGLCSEPPPRDSLAPLRLVLVEQAFEEGDGGEEVVAKGS